MVMQVVSERALQSIPHVTVWRVLRKRLHWKAYRLSVVQHLEDSSISSTIVKLFLKHPVFPVHVGEAHKSYFPIENTHLEGDTQQKLHSWQTQCPGLILGHPVPGRYKYGNLALQVGGVSDETVKYGYGSWALSHYTANCRPVLSSERAPNRYKTANFTQQHSDRK
jgi:hypothetical protein